MGTVHISETEFVRDPRGALDRVKRGQEVVVEDDEHRRFILSREVRHRSIFEAIVIAKSLEAIHGGPIRPDPGFAKDVEEFIAAHPEPLDPPAWD